MFEKNFWLMAFSKMFIFLDTLKYTFLETERFTLSTLKFYLLLLLNKYIDGYYSLLKCIMSYCSWKAWKLISLHWLVKSCQEFHQEYLATNSCSVFLEQLWYHSQHFPWDIKASFSGVIQLLWPQFFAFFLSIAKWHHWY